MQLDDDIESNKHWARTKLRLFQTEPFCIIIVATPSGVTLVKLQHFGLHGDVDWRGAFQIRFH